MKYKSYAGYLVLAVAVAALSIGATWTYANLTATTINACISKIGTVRILADGAPLKCMKTERLLSWNIMGPKGDVGPMGPQGVPGVGWDESRFAALEARTTALEATPSDPPTDPEDPGESHEDGLFAEIVSTDAESVIRDDGKDYAQFTIKLDLTAYGDDYFVSATSTDALGLSVRGDAGAVAHGIVSSARSSTADKEGDAFRINEGETETFTLTIAFIPDSIGFYFARLEHVQYGDTATTPVGTTLMLEPVEDYETDYTAVMD